MKKQKANSPEDDVVCLLEGLQSSVTYERKTISKVAPKPFDNLGWVVRFNTGVEKRIRAAGKPGDPPKRDPEMQGVSS